ncbi:MAG: histidine kinase [Melioribacteraceae bacterium]
MRLRNKKNKEQFEIIERTNELKHKALSAMMNPHFISNSLNSVQYLINSGQYEDANNYIAMLAKLMRKNLDTAGNGFILLNEEITRLRLYLELEKLRFQESFSYDIIIGEGIETESTFIPNMIIQPFVENSLWHGIMNSGQNGKLTISFTIEDFKDNSVGYKLLCIKIKDNGIGIKKAMNNKIDNHISKGIEIVKERLKLLSIKMEVPQPIMIEDLSSQNIDSHGTEVVILLHPPLYKTQI